MKNIRHVTLILCLIVYGCVAFTAEYSARTAERPHAHAQVTRSLTFEQAIEKVSDGKRVRRESWPKGHYIYADKQFVRKHTDTWDGAYVLLVEDAEAEDWQV